MKGCVCRFKKDFLRLNESIQQAAEKANRSLDEIQLVAISKTKPAEAVREAFKAGQLVFGENRVQEAVEKIDLLQYLSGLEWHLVGHLQKTRRVSARDDFNGFILWIPWNWQKGFPGHVLNKTLR